MKKHKWSGWPGAFCLDCGSEDPYENAIGLRWISICEDKEGNILDKWDTEEHKKEVERADICYGSPTNHD